jgi:uncharacterized protein YkwD
VSVVAIGSVVIGGAVWQSVSSASDAKPIALRSERDPIQTRYSAPTPTTAAPAPEPVPEPEPEPEPEPAPAPAPKKKAPAPVAPAPESAPRAATASPSDAAQLISMVNQYRADHGLPALARAGDATAKAQKHSDDMAAQGRMFHSSSMSSGISPGWSSLGENVGVGGSASQVESMFEASGPHRSNILSESFTQIGVGVTIGDDGQLYVTEFFVGR